MSETVIRVDRLSKSYVIAHQRKRERYLALRDVLSRTAKSSVTAGLNALRGRRVIFENTAEEFLALSNVSFDVSRGDVIGIVGRNGAGKSTLLKVLSRITEPSSGRIEISGRVASLLEVGTGFHPELTGRENIYLNGAILGMRHAEIWKAVGNSSFAFSVVREAHAGLAYARRAGTRAASHDVIVFCDDDNWLDEDYLIQARRIMADRSIGAAGGCSTPTNPGRLPPWFYTFSWGYAVGVPFNKIDVLPGDSNTELPISAVWGAGVVVRREVLEFLFALPGFPALSGRQGAALLSGEDLEMCACLACAGYKLVFSTALRFRHDISAERIDPAYAKKLLANFSSGFEITGYYSIIAEALDRPWRVSIVGFGRIATHALSGKLNRGSFLSLVAALRLPVLLTNDQRRVYHIVQRLRFERSKSEYSRLHGKFPRYLYAQPK